MPDIETIATALKVLLSTSALAGAFMTLMGLGIVPLDETKIAAVANVFLSPLGVPIRPFLLILGIAKIIGVLSLWEIGPVPLNLGIAGLAMSAGCASYGHWAIGDNPEPAIASVLLLLWLFVLERRKASKQSATQQ